MVDKKEKRQPEGVGCRFDQPGTSCGSVVLVSCCVRSCCLKDFLLVNAYTAPRLPQKNSQTQETFSKNFQTQKNQNGNRGVGVAVLIWQERTVHFQSARSCCAETCGTSGTAFNPKSYRRLPTISTTSYVLANNSPFGSTTASCDSIVDSSFDFSSCRPVFSPATQTSARKYRGP